MRNRFPLAVATLLAACGAATSSNSTSDTTDSTSDAANGSSETAEAREKQAPPKQDPLNSFFELQDAVDSGGIPGCFDPALSGRERAVAERLGGVPCETPRTRPPAASSAGSDEFDGYWTGHFDGGGGSATIARQSPGRYGVQVGVAGNDGCSGSVQGQATVRAGRLVLTAPIPDQGGLCRITFTRSGSRLAVEEDNCMYFHGMSCGFSGSLTSRESNDLAPPEGHSE